MLPEQKQPSFYVKWTLDMSVSIGKVKKVKSGNCSVSLADLVVQVIPRRCVPPAQVVRRWLEFRGPFASCMRSNQQLTRSQNKSLNDTRAHNCRPNSSLNTDDIESNKMQFLKERVRRDVAGGCNEKLSQLLYASVKRVYMIWKHWMSYILHFQIGRNKIQTNYVFGYI